MESEMIFELWDIFDDFNERNLKRFGVENE
jgi:hypothetical protein